MIQRNIQVYFLVFRSGLTLACLAVFLQIAVFLQPLLPRQYQVAPVCETIANALVLKISSEHQHDHQHDGHDDSHQCQYCKVYSNLVLPQDLTIKEVLDRIQVRLLAFQKTFSHIWFILQRLFLTPQGRAPPLLN